MGGLGPKKFSTFGPSDASRKKTIKFHLMQAIAFYSPCFCLSNRVWHEQIVLCTIVTDPNNFKCHGTIFAIFWHQKTHYFLERTHQNLTHRMHDATHCWQLGASVAAGANVTKVFWQLISRKWEYEPIRQFELSVLLCILCKCNCRRNSSHCKSATQFAPQKYVSLITEKFPKEEGGQWPTSVTHFAKVTYLRPPTRLFHSPTLRRLGLCCDRSKPPRGIDVEQSSPRPDWIQNSQAHPAGRSQKLPPEAEQ